MSGRGRRFLWFLDHVSPNEIALAEKADGIVVLTGGASRIEDAIELLARGNGQRLLISGVNPLDQRAREIAQLRPEHEKIIACCVDLDRTAVNTIDQCHRDAALGDGARLQVADRGDLELSHAACDGGIVASASRDCP